MSPVCYRHVTGMIYTRGGVLTRMFGYGKEKLHAKEAVVTHYGLWISFASYSNDFDSRHGAGGMVWRAFARSCELLG